jgi:hypothetical protein
MANEIPERPGAAGEAATLSYREERFVEEYVRNGGNAAAAYRAAHPGVTVKTSQVEGSKTLAKPVVQDAIEAEREQLRAVARFSREDAIRILVAIATTTPDQVVDAMRSPNQEESYVGLGVKKHAMQVQKTPEGYMASCATIAERRAALNDLWEKLGLGKESGGRDRLAFFDAILGLAGKPAGESEKR